MNKPLIDLKEKERIEMYEAFAYFAAGGRHASEGMKGMPVGALEESKVEFFERRDYER